MSDGLIPYKKVQNAGEPYAFDLLVLGKNGSRNATTPTVASIQTVAVDGTVTAHTTLSDVTVETTDDGGTPTPAQVDGFFVAKADVNAINPPSGGTLVILFDVSIGGQGTSITKSFLVEEFTASEISDDIGNPEIK